MNKGKSFLCALISETIRLLKYVLYVLAFSDYTTNYTVITVIIIQVQLLKQFGWNKLYYNKAFRILVNEKDLA